MWKRKFDHHQPLAIVVNLAKCDSFMVIIACTRGQSQHSRFVCSYTDWHRVSAYGEFYGRKVLHFAILIAFGSLYLSLVMCFINAFESYSHVRHITHKTGWISVATTTVPDVKSTLRSVWPWPKHCTDNKEWTRVGGRVKGNDPKPR